MPPPHSSRKKKKTRARRPAAPPPPEELVVEHYPGLEDLARAELRHLGQSVRLLDTQDPAETRFRYGGKRSDLEQLRTITALHSVTRFDVPRPRALLGHAHWQRLRQAVAGVVKKFPPAAFGTFRIAAAGHHSAVFRRIKETLSAEAWSELGEA